MHPQVTRPAGTNVFTLLQRAGLVGLLVFTLVALTPVSVEALPFKDTAWAVLTGKQKDEIAQTLAKELNDYYSGRVADAKKEEKEKVLGQLLKQDTEPKGPPDSEHKLAKMVYEGFLDDPKKFSEILGEVSAGEYTQLKAELPNWGAAAFASLVSDKLDDLGFEQTKVVWDALVGRADDMQTLGKAFMRGDWDNLSKSLKALAIKEAKAASKEAIADAVNWVFSPLGSFMGSGYVKVLEAEIEFLEWSKKFISRQESQLCLDTYVQEHDRLAGQGSSPAAAESQAFEEFRDCSILPGRTFEFFQFEEYVRAAGLDTKDVYLRMLESYRADGTRPSEWLADELARQKEMAERLLNQDLAQAKTEVDRAADRVNSAMQTRLQALIAEALGEEKIDELGNLARKALADTQPEIELFRRAYAGVLGACTDFEAAKKDATETVEASLDLVDTAGGLNIAADGFVGCTPDANMLATLQIAATQSQSTKTAIVAAAQSAEAGMESSCLAMEQIKGAASAESARRLLDDVTSAAAEVAVAVEAGTTAYSLLTSLDAQARQSISARIGPDPREKLAQMEADLAFLQSDLPVLQSQLTEIQAVMNAAQRTAVNLEAFGIAQTSKIRFALAPYDRGPLTKEIKAVFDELDRDLSEMGVCRLGAVQAWTRGEDGGVRWQTRAIGITPPLQVLSGKVEALKARCASAADADPAALQQQISDLVAELDPEMGVCDAAKYGADRCVADAVMAVANWGKLAIPAVQGMPVDQALATLRGAGFSPEARPLGPAPFGETPDIVESQEPGPEAGGAQPGDKVVIAYYENPSGAGSGQSGEAPADAWSGPWRGTLKLTRLEASVGAVTLACTDAAMCPSALRSTLQRIIADDQESIFIGVPAGIFAYVAGAIEVGLHGVEIGFELKQEPGIAGYKVGVPGLPADQAKPASAVPRLLESPPGVLRATVDAPGEIASSWTVEFKLGPGAEQGELTVIGTASGAGAGRLEARGSFVRGILEYATIEAALKGEVERHAQPYVAIAESTVKKN